MNEDIDCIIFVVNIYEIYHRKQPPPNLFSTLEDQVAVDNTVKLIDAFINKPGLKKLILLSHRKAGSCLLLHFISKQLPAEGIAR